MLKNYQKLEFNLGHLGTGGKLYFHEYLPKIIPKIQTPSNLSIFVLPPLEGVKKLSKTPPSGVY